MVGMLSFQKLRVYQLADQLLRAAQSQPRNIAEGAGRCTKVDQVRFSMHARGSANEDDVTTHRPRQAFMFTFMSMSTSTST